MSLLRNVEAAARAVDALANTPGASAGDRARQLSALRARLDGQIQTLAAQAERALGRNPVSQQEGS